MMPSRAWRGARATDERENASRKLMHASSDARADITRERDAKWGVLVVSRLDSTTSLSINVAAAAVISLLFLLSRALSS